MNFEPQKFFIGVIDLFSILLPGALLTFLMQDELGPLVFGGDGYNALTGVAGWLAFLVSAYLVGHFIFLFGAWALDTPVYDRIRNATRQQQINRLARGEPLSWWLTRALARDAVKPNSDVTVALAVRIKDHYIARLGSPSAINAFQWCKARLSLENRADALAEVERFEADSKFFRSLVIVIPIFMAWKLAHGAPVAAIYALPLLWLALWRYVDQRVKATNQSYWHVIALEANAEEGFRHTPVEHRNPSHAGGVVYRRDRNGPVTFLVAQALRNPVDWILPKGHIERDEQPAQAAVREVLEEAGVWGRVERKLPTIAFVLDGAPVVVQYYLMRAEGEERAEENRKPVWLPFDQAIVKLSHEESQTVLRVANAVVPREPP